MRQLTEEEQATFWGKTSSLETGQCWLWKGGFFVQGYGNFYHDGMAQKAHRVAWRIANPGEGMPEVVMHTCDNPACVNPSHLVGGTRADNNADMREKGRSVMPHQVFQERIAKAEAERDRLRDTQRELVEALTRLSRVPIEDFGWEKRPQQELHAWNGFTLYVSDVLRARAALARARRES